MSPPRQMLSIEPICPVTKVKLPYLPREVDLSDVKEVVVGENGHAQFFILAENERKQIIASLSKKPDGRYTKNHRKDSAPQRLNLKAERSNYSIIKSQGRYYAVYKGMKQNKHAGAGMGGVVKYIQDLETGLWRVVKVFSAGHKLSNNDQRKPRKKEDLQAYAQKEFKALKEVMPGSTSAPLHRESGSSKGEQYFIIMDDAPGQDLEIVRLNLQAMQRKWSARQWLNLIRGMALKVQEFHDQKHLHRDIKPGNFRYDKEEIKLIDFNFVITMTEAPHGMQYLEENVGTPLFAAPEIYREDVNGKTHYSTKSDAYALGASIADLLNILDPASLPSKLCAIDTPSITANIHLQDQALLRGIHQLCAGLMHPNVDARLSVPAAIANIAELTMTLPGKTKIGVVDINEFDLAHLPQDVLNDLDQFDEIILIDTLPQRRMEERLALIRHIQKADLHVRKDLLIGTNREEIFTRVTHELQQRMPNQALDIRLYSYTRIDIKMVHEWRQIKSVLSKIDPLAPRIETLSLAQKRQLVDRQWPAIDAFISTLACAKLASADRALSEAEPANVADNCASNDSSSSMLSKRRIHLSDQERVQAEMFNYSLQKLAHIAKTLTGEYWHYVAVSLREVREYLNRIDIDAAEAHAYLTLKYNFIMQLVTELVSEANIKLTHLVANKNARVPHNGEQSFLLKWIEIENLIADTDNMLNNVEIPAEQKNTLLLQNLQDLQRLKRQLLSSRPSRPKHHVGFLVDDLQQAKNELEVEIDAANSIAKHLTELTDMVGNQWLPARDPVASLLEPIEVDSQVAQKFVTRQADFQQLNKCIAIIEIYKRRYHEAQQPMPKLNELVIKLALLRQRLLDANPHPLLFTEVESLIVSASIEVNKSNLASIKNKFWLETEKIALRNALTTLKKTHLDHPPAARMPENTVVPLTLARIKELKAPFDAYLKHLRSEKHQNPFRKEMTLACIRALEDITIAQVKQDTVKLQTRLTNIREFIAGLKQTKKLNEHSHFNFFKQVAGRKTKLQAMVDHLDTAIRIREPELLIELEDEQAPLMTDANKGKVRKIN